MGDCVAPPDKDDEGKKTSADPEAKEPDPAAEEDGTAVKPQEGESPETEPDRKDDAAKAPELDPADAEVDGRPADVADRDEPGQDVDDPDEPAETDSGERIGDPVLEEPADATAEAAPKQSEPVTRAGAPPPAPPPPAPASGGRFWTALLGTLIGVAVGAGAVWYVLQQMPREPDAAVVSTLDRQEEEIAAQSDTLAVLEGEIQALREELAGDDLAAVETLRGEIEARLDEALAGLGERLDTMNSRLGEVGGRVDDVAARLDEGEARIAELEARPIADPETANQTLREEVADMRAEVEQATEDARAQVETMRNELAEAAAATQAEIEAAERRAAELEAEARERAAAVEAEAEEAARAAAAQAALAQIDAALDSGEPYAEVLAELSANAEAEVPEALAAPAETGVPTLGDLRESYPDAARAALGASRVATAEGDPGSRVLAFIRTQTGARSLTPQEGDTPDAVLSRAEAALAAGDLRAALTELEALPEGGREAMQDWIDSAEVRAQAAAAADTLSEGNN